MRRTTLGPVTGGDLLNLSALDSSSLSLEGGGTGGKQRSSLSTSFVRASVGAQEQRGGAGGKTAPGTGGKPKTAFGSSAAGGRPSIAPTGDRLVLRDRSPRLSVCPSAVRTAPPAFTPSPQPLPPAFLPAPRA